MKMLIVYISKTGTTEKCAKIINTKFKNSELLNLASTDECDIKNYDYIIIGTPIRMGIINKKIKKFILNNEDVLLSKNVSYFICCGFNENKNSYFEQNYKKELLDKSIIYESFGGEMNINRQKGIDKVIAKMVSKTIKDNKKIEIINNNIELFIKTINDDINK